MNPAYSDLVRSLIPNLEDRSGSDLEVVTPIDGSVIAGLRMDTRKEVDQKIGAAVEAFKAYAPDVHTATATGETAAFWATAQGPLPGGPNPRYQALQVPIELNGIPVVTPEFVQRAHDNGLAVHVWTINDRADMEWLLDIGVDGIMTDRPTLLEEVLAAR